MFPKELPPPCATVANSVGRSDSRVGVLDRHWIAASTRREAHGSFYLGQYPCAFALCASPALQDAIEAVIKEMRVEPELVVTKVPATRLRLSKRGK